MTGIAGAGIMSPLGLVALTLAIVGSATDVRSRRIPNWLTAGALLTALAYRLVSPESISAGLLGAGMGLVLTIPLFAIQSIGAGDVKYFTAFGAVLGAGRMIPALVLVSLAGGVLALMWALAQRRGTALMTGTASLAMYVLSLGFFGSRRVLSLSPREEAPAPIPLGVAIATGCLLVWFL